TMALGAKTGSSPVANRHVGGNCGAARSGMAGPAPGATAEDGVAGRQAKAPARSSARTGRGVRTISGSSEGTGAPKFGDAGGARTMMRLRSRDAGLYFGGGPPRHSPMFGGEGQRESAPLTRFTPGDCAMAAPAHTEG